MRTQRGARTLMLANITAASHKALDVVCSSGCHMAAVVETHVDGHRARRVQRQMQAMGYTTWLRRRQRRRRRVLRPVEA